MNMSANASATRCMGTRPVELAPRDVISRGSCLKGGHVVFVVKEGGAAIMRGHLIANVLQQTNASHGVRVTVFHSDGSSFDAHIRRHGPPSLCVLVKYASEAKTHECRKHGALVLVDNVDNHRGSDLRLLSQHGAYQSVDGIMVQTLYHANFVSRAGLRGIVLRHSHGNINSWSSAPQPLPPRPLGVGIVVGDVQHSTPSRSDIEAFVAVACLHNVTLYILNSQVGHGLTFWVPKIGEGNTRLPSFLTAKDVNQSRLLGCQNASRIESALRRAWEREVTAKGSRTSPPWLEPCAGADDYARTIDSWCAFSASERDALSVAADLGIARNAGASSDATEGLEAAAPSRGFSSTAASSTESTWLEPPRLAHLADHTHQSNYYTFRGNLNIHDLVDIGLTWWASNQKGNGVALNNRPPLRMHWWWSQGVPTVSNTMNGYVESARRVEYPLALINITKPTRLHGALCRLATPTARACLRRRALHAAMLTSPQYAARELLAAACEVAEACNRTLV